ncbi:MAG: sugar-binding transcriptional regulator, partial [Sinorhizobium meliloti]|nr:sugar-binding transcriptional regulator [Sinorhizobium meliloti]
MANAKPKSQSAPREEIVIARQMHQALVLHFLEGLTQAQIADQLGISHATVNRLIKRGRQLGLVEIKIKSPVEPLVEIEEQLLALGGIRRAVVVPTVSDNPQIALQSVGEAAARLMLEQIADGDTICITGGKGVSAVVAGLQPSRRFDIEVIPATGCVQGKHYTDVNHVATLMADRLGGHSFQIHAPLFADSEAEGKMLLGMRSVADVFKRARDAKIAVVGIGSILSDDSSYYDLHPSSSTDREAIEQSGASCELLAHLLDDCGRVCGYGLNRRLVSLTLSEFASIP